ncbi:two-component system sensor histidine kinase CreC [Janthinobacterium fluminis]|uniref:histidine kinase n=1 Tax=Janthinobacterium fluminis TaxID=2987524 RepID=A0ABT5K5Y7_9BURK|nr:two-component system sensor histidine kinase CreC [Janthinobacterium fluminis]MDC8760319.1 two-component system sensor histidine kinase CreC [Janthinobacterium fluminis]
MKIGLRILLGYFLIVGLAAWFLLNVFVEQVKPGVRATQEDTLVDTAQLLADLVADDVRAGRLQQSAIATRMQAYAGRKVDAKISGVAKETLDYRVYITDARGMVLFDSTGRDTGKDYSRWNDVKLTLQGKYGARSTRSRPDDDASTVMHVAAPIMDGARIIGVLTVAKPNSSVQVFVERSQQKILQRGAVLLLLSLLIGIAFAYWLGRALRRLMHYIGEVEAGRKATLPALGNNEIGTLGRALEAMRDKLEGKEYVEELMHTLAHELKSPIAAIQGSAELLQEDMPEAERRHFLANILNQNARQKQLIDKLLALVRVEKQQRLAAPERVDVAALLAQAGADVAARLAARGLRLEVRTDALSLHGDALLLRQAIGNLLDNAIDFAPPGSAIALSAGASGRHAEISVRDGGAGIPAYAQERLFERFYSLPRPDGAKSSGLGLPFVREVMALHRGTVEVRNGAAGGACATLRLPLS